MIDAARMIWTPTVCCVQPTAYAMRGGALGARVVAQGLGDREELLLRDAADLLDELGRVAAEVVAEQLEGAARVLHVHVDVRRAAAGQRHAVRAVGLLARDVGRLLALARDELAARVLVAPALGPVDAGLGVEAREEAVEVLGVLEVLADDRGAVREVPDVLPELAAVLEDVADHAAEERDVAAGADRDVEVGHRARAREPRVDVDDLRAALLGLHHPLEADRMALGHVRPHDQDAVGALQVLQEAWWLRRARTTSPDRGRSSCVICGPGSRSGSRPSR